MHDEALVKQLIEADGWKIQSGPFYNANLAAKKGKHVWSIKTVLSKQELERRGIKADKNAPPGSKRTVRFLGLFDDEGALVGVRHITTSERKRLGRGRKRGRTRARESGGVSAAPSSTSVPKAPEVVDGNP